MTRLPAEFLSLPIAHRALHDVSDGRPENSRAAILAAIEHGYGIEIDVQLSADNAAMVFHDYVMERLTSVVGTLRKFTREELSSVSLRGSDETIPDLQEILKLVAGRVPILLEIKDQDGEMGADIGPLEQAVADEVAVYKGPLALMSFNPHSVARIGEVCPDLPRGLVTSAFDPEVWPLKPEICAHLREIPDYAAVGACFISHEAADLDRLRVAELQAQGADVLCWTIRTQEAADEALRIARNVTFEGYLP